MAWLDRFRDEGDPLAESGVLYGLDEETERTYRTVHDELREAALEAEDLVHRYHAGSYHSGVTRRTFIDDVAAMPGVEAIGGTTVAPEAAIEAGLLRERANGTLVTTTALTQAIADRMTHGDPDVIPGSVSALYRWLAEGRPRTAREVEARVERRNGDARALPRVREILVELPGYSAHDRLYFVHEAAEVDPAALALDEPDETGATDEEVAADV